jgi:FKBP-type peptidyl-prolyl cis-trans isomerase FkpA
MKRILLFILALSFGFTSCNKEEKDIDAQLAIDKEIIEKYLNDNGLTAQSTASGLYYIIDNQGTGIKPSISSTVTVTYTGKFINGTVFDSRTASFPLTSVIQGWQEGIPLFNAGGTGKLFIPSGLGYGSTVKSSIPANSVLVFDIYLISVM